MMKGRGESVACGWQRQLLALYFNLSKKSFEDASHMTIITDASTHGTNNLQVSIAYNTKEDLAASQVLSASKKVAPNEFDLERDIERIIAREESKRLKAYKYMQALSHQIELLTKRTLPSYVPDEEWVSLVKPLQSPCHRMVSCDFININNERLNRLEIAVTQPVLGLLMDQGTDGMAACLFMKANHMMVSSDWDYYHRLANDLKLAGEKNHMIQSQLACQYVWGVNYKPFSTGQFFSEKQRPCTTSLTCIHMKLDSAILQFWYCSHLFLIFPKYWL